MNRIIVSVFDNEEKAFSGQTALKDLHLNGDISLYATAVVSKNDQGEVETKSISEKGPLGTRVGMISGAFVGLVGGPIGMALGASVGALGGMVFDSTKKAFGRNIIDEVAKELENGKTAVIAEVEEGWKTPVDTKMAELNAMVFRFNHSEKMEEQINREWETTEAELKELREELSLASNDAKAGIEAQIATLQNKMSALKELAEKELDQFLASTEAKVNELEKQFETAGEKAKTKLEKRLKEAKDTLESGRKTLEDTIDNFAKEIKSL
ncbi:MAG: DUF1269 domain-containing protein [Bacteroidia bacterium]|nr:DUF1269 domain-containing protein [Bacteroidia bacterium]